MAEVAERCGTKECPTAWVICKGVVYDVTGNEVYKSQGSYNLFAGNDVTVALARMSFD